jgi:hypothetical protein
MIHCLLKNLSTSNVLLMGYGDVISLPYSLRTLMMTSLAIMNGCVIAMTRFGDAVNVMEMDVNCCEWVVNGCAVDGLVNSSVFQSSCTTVQFIEKHTRRLIRLPTICCSLCLHRLCLLLLLLLLLLWCCCCFCDVINDRY